MSVIRTVTPAGAAFEKALKKLDDKVGKVGWFASSYTNGTSIPYVAAIQEFGDPSHNIHARPFMRPTVAKQQKKWTTIIGNEAKRLLNGETNSNDIMEKVGLQAAGDIRETITKVQSPRLADSTKDARTRRTADYQNLKTSEAKRRMLDGNRNNSTFNKPLVDTGTMLGALTNTVENKT